VTAGGQGEAVPIVWVGVEDAPVITVNQFLLQVHEGEFFFVCGDAHSTGSPRQPRRGSPTSRSRDLRAREDRSTVLTDSPPTGGTDRASSAWRGDVRAERGPAVTAGTYHVERRATALSSSGATTGVASAETLSSTPVPVTSVPRSQLYYWTRRWQEDEAAAVAELERGEGRRFDNPREAIRWLLAED
jgi:hypothetical protein